MSAFSSAFQTLPTLAFKTFEQQRFQPGAGWGSSDEDHLLPEDRAPLTGASGVHAIDDLDDIDPSSLQPSSYQWEDENPLINTHEEGWNAGPWVYADKFEAMSAELPYVADAPVPAPAVAGPGTPPPPPPDRPAGVRSRAWWRAMVLADETGGRVTRGVPKRESVACGRRKVPHVATSNSSGNSDSQSGGGGGSGAGKGLEDRIRVPLERLKRAAVVGPNTLIVELEVESRGGNWRTATLVVGPCDAPRLGSLLVERAATALPRAALGQVVKRARKLASKPPPLPPRPGGARGVPHGGGGSGSAAGGSARMDAEIGEKFSLALVMRKGCVRY